MVVVVTVPHDVLGSGTVAFTVRVVADVAINDAKLLLTAKSYTKGFLKLGKKSLTSMPSKNQTGACSKTNMPNKDASGSSAEREAGRG